MTIRTIFYRSSSFITNVAWDEDSESLMIKFNSGTTWVYYNVPESVYISLIRAESVGSYFNNNIRDLYSSQRINYKFQVQNVEKEEKEQKEQKL